VEAVNPELDDVLDPRPLQPNERVCSECHIAYNRHLPACPDLVCS
jgi:hypothetical protein